MSNRIDRLRALNILLLHLPLGVAVVWLVSAAVWVAISPRARADEAHQNKVYATGFEPLTFEAGSALVGVDGWTTLFFMDPDAARITGADKKSGRQSVEVWGGDLESTADFTFPPYDAVGSYRRPVNYSVSSDKPIVVVEADLLLETDERSTGDDFFGLTIAARSGDGETLGEIGITSHGRAVAYQFNALPDADPLFTSPIDFNRWFHLTMVFDFSGETTTTSYFLDGELIGSTDEGSTSKVLLRGAMVVYALPDSYGDERANYTARFDNFRISVHGVEGD